MATILPHIKIGYIVQSGTFLDMDWLGKHCDVLISSTKPDFSAAFAANPDMEVYIYLSGVGLYYPPHDANGRLYFDNMDLVIAANPGWSMEDFFYHYRASRDYKLAPVNPARAARILFSGYEAGLDPGYGAGPATALAHSRMISGRWGDNIDYRVSLPISSIRRDAGVVTVTTPSAHYLKPGLRCEISGVADGYFNGVQDVFTVPSSTQFTYLQMPLGNAVSSGGTYKYEGWSNWNYNVIHPLFKTFLRDWWIPYFCTDAGGNKLHGPFWDSATMNLLGIPGLFWQNTIEYFNAGSPEDYISWVMNWTADYWRDTRDNCNAFRGDLKGRVCGNGSGFPYIYTDRRIYLERPESCGIIVAESAFMPNNGPTINIYSDWGILNQVSSQWEPLWKNAWAVMDAGNAIFFQSYPNGTFGDSYHDQPITWTQHSPLVWYTDAYSDSRTAPTIIGALPGGAFYASMGSIAAIVAPGQFYWDTATRRLYAYFASPPVAGSASACGLERQRLWSLAQFYVFGNNQGRAIFSEHAWSPANYASTIPSPRVWHDGITHNVGSPVVGGVKEDGSVATDIWGESCATSNKGFEWWRNPVSANDRIYGRLYSGALCLFRRSPSQSYCGHDVKTFTLSAPHQFLHGDGTLDPPSLTFTLATGEGAILIPVTAPRDRKVLLRRS